MPKRTKKTVKEPVVIVRILLGTPTPAARASYRRFWQKIISDVKANEREGRQKR